MLKINRNYKKYSQTAQSNNFPAVIYNTAICIPFSDNLPFTSKNP